MSTAMPSGQRKRNRRFHGLQYKLAVAGVAVALGLAAACGGGKTTAPPAGNAGSQPAPSKVAGYGNCTDPSCADVARACDDLIRSGCAGPFIGQGAQKPEPGSPEFKTALDDCTMISYQELEEGQESAGGSSAGSGDAGTDAGSSSDNAEVVVARLALEAARCTRRATTCEQRFDCLRGMTIPPRVPGYDAGPPQDAGLPVTEPSWKKPWTASGKDPLWAGPPWVDAGGSSKVFLVPGVDSPSCARCAMERCPTFAYLCFSAEGDAQKCPNGDCCESMRRCIVRQGGYGPGADPLDFYRAMTVCQVGRPHAAQQLGNLQQCAEVACAGCQNFDKHVQIAATPDGGWTEVDGGP